MADFLDILDQQLADFQTSLILDQLLQSISETAAYVTIVSAVLAPSPLSATAAAAAIWNLSTSLNESERKLLVADIVLQRAKSMVLQADYHFDEASRLFQSATESDDGIVSSLLLESQKSYLKGLVFREYAVGSVNAAISLGGDTGLSDVFTDNDAIKDVLNLTGSLLKVFDKLGAVQIADGLIRGLNAAQDASSLSSIIETLTSGDGSAADLQAAEDTLSALPSIESVNAQVETFFSTSLIGDWHPLVDAFRLLGDETDNTLDAGDAQEPTLVGRAGDDALTGGSGQDTLLGGADDDVLNGGEGSDSLNGQEGDDTLSGGNDNDLLQFGVGNDEVSGGPGNDIYRAVGTDGHSQVTDVEGLNSMSLDRLWPEYTVDFSEGSLIVSLGTDWSVTISEFEPENWLIGGLSGEEIQTAIDADLDGLSIDLGVLATAYTGTEPLVSGAQAVTKDSVDFAPRLQFVPLSLEQGGFREFYDDDLLGLWNIDVDQTENPDGQLTIRLDNPNILETGQAYSVWTLSLLDSLGEVFATDTFTYFNTSEYFALPNLYVDGLEDGTYTLALQYSGGSVPIDQVDLWTWQGVEDADDAVGGGQVLLATQIVDTGPQLLFHDLQAGTFEVFDTTDLAPVEGFGELARNGFQVGGKYFFTATTSANGWELWATDGSVEGTELVLDLVEGAGSGRPKIQAILDDKLLIMSGDRRDLYLTDGTAGGTEAIFSISSDFGFLPTYDDWGDAPISVNGELYFSAIEFGQALDVQIWRSDGSGIGTEQITNPAGRGLSGIAATASDGDTGYWIVQVTGRYEVWTLDADAEFVRGPSFESVSFNASGYATLATLNGGAVFAANDGTGERLWITDGTIDGTTALTEAFDVYAANRGLMLVGDYALFEAFNSDEGRELWVTDGTELGTYQVSDNAPGQDFGLGDVLYWDDRSILFTNNDNNELWMWDGSSVSPELISFISQGPLEFEAAFQSGDLVYFSLGTDQLVVRDLNGSQTILGDVMPQLGVTDFYSPIALPDGAIVFRGIDSEFGPELWYSDGTVDGTALLADVKDGIAGSNPFDLRLIGTNAPVDATVPLSLTVPVFALEGDTAEVVVNRPEGLAGDVEITWEAGGDGPGPLQTGTITLATEAMSASFQVEIPDDASYVAPYYGLPIRITEATVEEASVSFVSEAAEIFVVDDDWRAVLSIADTTASESDDLVFDLSLDRPLSSDIFVTYAISRLTAEDFDIRIPVSQEVMIAAGETTGEITIPVREDTVLEALDLIQLDIVAVRGADVEVSPRPAVGTIIDNEVLPTDQQDFITVEDSFGDVYLGGGDDFLTAGSGQNRIAGGKGNDYIITNDDEDIIFGQGGDDTLDGGNENDSLSGGTGEDSLFGGFGRDVLSGGADNDTLAGGGGADVIRTDDGEDLVTGTLAELDGDRIVDFSDGDVLRIESLTLNGGGVSVAAGSAILGFDGDGDGTDEAVVILEGDYSETVFAVDVVEGDTLIRIASPEAVMLSDAGERFITGNTTGNQIYGASGDDFVLAGSAGDLVAGGSGSDVLLGGFGDDTIGGGAGNDEMTGGAGGDTFAFSAADFDGFGVDTITDFTPDEDTIVLSGFGETGFVSFASGVAIDTGIGGFIVLEGLAEEALVAGDIVAGPALGFALASLAELHVFTGADDRFVTTEDLANVVRAGGGNDSVLTAAGDDWIEGDAGSDFLAGGAGEDTIVGGAGNDVLSGGLGADRFEFAAGETGFINDTITDFEIGEDVVALSGYAAPVLLELLGSAAAQLSATEFVVFEGVTLAELEAAEEDVFVFG